MTIYTFTTEDEPKVEADQGRMQWRSRRLLRLCREYRRRGLRLFIQIGMERNGGLMKAEIEETERRIVVLRELIYEWQAARLALMNLPDEPTREERLACLTRLGAAEAALAAV